MTSENMGIKKSSFEIDFNDFHVISQIFSVNPGFEIIMSGN